MEKRILVVDSDHAVHETARDALVSEGFELTGVSTEQAALQYLEQKGPVEILITDPSSSDIGGLGLVERLRHEYPKMDVIVASAEESPERSLQAMRLGAVDHLRKPIMAVEVVYCVKRTMLRRRLVAENASLRGRVQAFEAVRPLSTCLETNDILPLALDIMQRLLGRHRAVGRWAHMAVRPGDGTFISGFSPRETSAIRDEIERGKLFDPLELDGTDSRGSLNLQEGLGFLGLDDEHLMALPLHDEGQIVGGIWVFSDGRPFDEDDQRRGELVAAQAELAFVNAERFLRAREKAFVDDVTDLYNARYLLAAIDREVNRAERGGLEFSVLFLDLDRFKNVNDQYGHLVGSRVLWEFGQLLQSSIRTIDSVARYGGDEFCVILVDTGPEGALAVAERMRETTEQFHFGAENGLSISLTVSAGISSFPTHGGTRDSLLDQSDKAMYLGKSLGRNRVCSADELTSPGPGTL